MVERKGNAAPTRDCAAETAVTCGGRPDPDLLSGGRRRCPAPAAGCCSRRSAGRGGSRPSDSSCRQVEPPQARGRLRSRPADPSAPHCTDGCRARPEVRTALCSRRGASFWGAEPRVPAAALHRAPSRTAPRPAPAPRPPAVPAHRPGPELTRLLPGAPGYP